MIREDEEKVRELDELIEDANDQGLTDQAAALTAEKATLDSKSICSVLTKMLHFLPPVTAGRRNKPC